MYKNLRISFIIVFMLSVAFESKGQDVISSDDLLTAGRAAMSGEKDYPKAINLLRKAHSQSPEYTEVTILLGRAYQLNSQVDSARYFFERARLKEPANADLLNYLIGLEYGAGNTNNAISYIDSALVVNPKSEELLLKKASMLYDEKEYNRSQLAINELMAVNNKNQQATRLKNQLAFVTSSNTVSLNYDYSHFDELFNPWHSTSLAYQRTTGIGSISGRVTYANRSNGLSGYQYELEAYPLISKSVYGNFAVALSSGDPVFPQLTTRGALYKSLGSFELEGGLRYVSMPDEHFFIYNGGVSKYVSNFLLNFKAYIMDFKGATGQGFQVSSRYYYSENPNNVFIVGAGTGIAPDLSNRNMGIGNLSNLSGKRLFAEYRRVISTVNILSLLASAGNDEYTSTKSANQYSIGLGFQRKF